jgi:hypothetical protein
MSTIDTTRPISTASVPDSGICVPSMRRASAVGGTWQCPFRLAAVAILKTG